MTLEWTKDPSGGWYAKGDGGRLYRYHTLSGLKVGSPGASFEVPLMGLGHKDALDFSVVKRIAQQHEDGQV